MRSLASVARRRPTVNVSGADLYDNPYPVYRRLRQEAPVAHAPWLRHFAGQSDTYWLVTRWDEVIEILKDDELYRSPPEPRGLPSTFSGGLLYLDGEEHARVRASMQPACQPRRAAAFVDSVVPPVADQLIDAFEPAGHVDLVDAYCQPLAAITLARLLGLEDVPVDDLRRWFDHLGCFFIGEPLPQDPEIEREIDDALLGSIRRREGSPDSSLVSTMLQARDQAAVEERHILANAKVFAAAGVHELGDLLAHALVGLFSRPEQLERVQEDQALAKRAIEEAARWGTPVGMVPRVTASAVKLAGVRVPAGAYLAVVVASANRDERRWTDGDRFDVDRDEGMHVGFASGVHFCIGAWHSRSTGAIALHRLLERLPGLRLDRSDRLIVTGWRFRDVRRLPVVWS